MHHDLAKNLRDRLLMHGANSITSAQASLQHTPSARPAHVRRHALACAVLYHCMLGTRGLAHLRSQDGSLRSTSPASAPGSSRRSSFTTSTMPSASRNLRGRLQVGCAVPW